MSDLPWPCPGPPGWRVDWTALDRDYPWVAGLRGCPQDAVHHAEGDVWIHTRMVCEALATMPAWRALPEGERALVFAGALLHDVAKPACTREEGGHITSRGHSVRGEIQARAILWRLGVPLAAREAVANLVRYHQIPFFLVERDDHLRLALRISQTVRCDHLALVAEADARGRVCQDLGRLLDNIALYVELCREERCLDGPRRFPSDHSRFLYFRKEGRDPDYLAHDDTRADVVLMSGLPGAGKDHWIRRELPGWPVVSLDQLRRELDLSPTDGQGAVIAAADETAREHLRAGRSFVWNATNLSRALRSTCINLFAAYQARVRIVYLEVPEARLLRQNRERPTPIPEAALRRLLERWEVPDLTEAHRVDWITP